MAVSFINSDVYGSDSTNSVALGGPLTYTDDDGLIALLNLNNDSVTVSGSHGFSTLASGTPTSSPGGHSFWIGYKDALASETTDFAFALSSTTRATGFLLQTRGAAAMEPDATLIQTTWETGSNSTEAASLSVADNSIAIAWSLMDTNSSGNTYDSVDNSFIGLTARESNQLQAFAYRIFASADADTGETKITQSGTTDHAGMSFSFKEGAGGGATNPKGPLGMPFYVPFMGPLG